MKQLLIYERPLPLNRTRHRDIRIRPRTGDFAFAARLNSVPLTCGEFPAAARHFPIVFASSSTDVGMPVALLGLTRRDNLFVAPSGQWDEGVYVPAFLRRYPFVVADSQDSDPSFTVCIDETVIAAGEGDDLVRLFDDEGKESPALQRALHFLADYQLEVERTRVFLKTLIEYGLLVRKRIELRRAGSTVPTLHGFSVIDEKKLRTLDGGALARLSSTGALAMVYAHLMSLGRMQGLLERLDVRQRMRPNS